MSSSKGLVLDANILIRAVLGRRVRDLLETYERTTAFYAPDVCYEDASRYIPQILTLRAKIRISVWRSCNRLKLW